MKSRQVVETILKAALQAVDPEKSTKFILKEKNILTNAGTIDFVAFGKAAVTMSRGLIELGQKKINRGVIATKYHHVKGYVPSFGQVEIIESGHPLPDENSVKAGKAIVKLLESSTADTLIFLISGGGSALVTVPQNNITLTELQETTKLLLSSGATVQEINTIRKHLDKVKGGGLIKLLSPEKNICVLVLSDVLGDDLSSIASGPTVPDPSTFNQAVDILQKYSILEKVPFSVQSYLQDGAQGKEAETLKNIDVHKNVHHYFVGNLHIAIKAAENAANSLGYLTSVKNTSLQGEAREVAKEIILEAQKEHQKPTCLLYGGETTVTIKGNGRGGRNQELVLAALIELKESSNITIASIGTDGTDGPTDAAGAVVTPALIQKVKEMGVDPQAYLDNNDAYSFFEKVGGLIKTGPTGTNVNDLIIVMID